MQEAIETLEKDGYTASLFQDYDAASPDDWDQLATFEHSAGFTFGTPMSEPSRGWAVYIRSLTLFGEAVAALPVRVSDYGSSGLRISETTADNANGVMFTTDARLTELCGEGPEYHSREWATEALRGELAQWNQYAEGDVYGYVVKNAYGEHLDSCWGFYGFEYAKEELARALNDGIEMDRARMAQVAAGWAAAHGL